MEATLGNDISTTSKKRSGLKKAMGLIFLGSALATSITVNGQDGDGGGSSGGDGAGVPPLGVMI